MNRKEAYDIYLNDPYLLWEKFPCPPPWNKQLLFKVDYKHLLAPEDGLRIILRIAERCEVQIPEMLVVPGQIAGNAIFATCEGRCVNTIALTCVIVFLIMTVIVIYLFRRQHTLWRRGKMTVAKIYYESDIDCECLDEFDGSLKRRRQIGCNKCTYRYGKYTKTGSIGKRQKNGRCVLDDSHSALPILERNGTYRQFPCVDSCPLQSTSDISSMRNDFHIYETLEKYNSRINEFTLLRKAFKKYYGRDIDFSESPYSLKTETTRSCCSSSKSSEALSFAETESGEFTSTKRISKRLDYELKNSVYNDNFSNDNSDLEENRYGVKFSEIDTECNGFCSIDFEPLNTSYNCSTLKKKLLISEDKMSSSKNTSEKAKLRLSFSDDSDNEDVIIHTFQRNSKNSTDISKFTSLKMPHTYERLTSTTSAKTDTTTISDDSVELIVPDTTIRFSTFK